MDIKTYLKEMKFTNNEILKICNKMRKRSLKKNSILIEKNQRIDEIYFIEKGIVRGVYLDENGKERTKCFAAEGMWCAIYNYIRKTPYNYRIEVIENLEVQVILVSDFEEILNNIKNCKIVFEKLCMEALELEENRAHDLLMLDAKERYSRFLALYPDIAKRIKQEYIASYIGVTPESLSRAIRK